jgi:hypothetical protein
MAKKTAKAKKRTGKKATARKAAKRSTAKKTAAKKPRPGTSAPPSGDAPAGRLIPPPDGVTIRIYRIGHGDCHLLAFPGEAADKPVYVLIDCGYKPGSPGMMKLPRARRGSQPTFTPQPAAMSTWR